MPVEKTVYAGVVEYQEGDVVTWNLSWEASASGIPPRLDTAAQLPGKIPVVFTHRTDGGALGTATLRATVNGVQTNSIIVQTTEEAS